MILDKAAAELFHKALTGSGETLLSMIPSAAPDVLPALLKNPSLAENQLLAIVKRRDLGEDILKSLCKHPLVESSHNLKVALARHPKISAPQLSVLLPHLYLFELLNLCLLPEITPDQKFAAERLIIQRLPVTPLGNKLTLARRATPAVLEALLKDKEPRVLEICLSNPKLKEGVVFQFLRSSSANAETLSIVARHPRWQSRPNLREAILTNPKTPPIWFTLWLPGMKIAEVKRLLSSNRLVPAQKRLVEERLKR
jgi:hypothetical protein